MTEDMSVSKSSIYPPHDTNMNPSCTQVGLCLSGLRDCPELAPTVMELVPVLMKYDTSVPRYTRSWGEFDNPNSLFSPCLDEQGNRPKQGSPDKQITNWFWRIDHFQKSYTCRIPQTSGHVRNNNLDTSLTSREEIKWYICHLLKKGEKK